MRRTRTGRAAAPSPPPPPRRRRTRSVAPRRRRRRSKVVTAQDVRDAAAGLAGVAVRTPLRYVELLNAYLKLETLQPVGAVNLRGRNTADARLPARAPPGREGGGGGAGGVVTGLAAAGSRAQVWGVEPVGAPKLTRSLAAGRPVRLERTASLADGLITLTIGAIPFAHLAAARDRLAGVVLVEDDTLREAVHFLWQQCHLAVEPSGAATTAALRPGAVPPAPPTCLVAPGANVDSSLLAYQHTPNCR